MCVHLYEYIYRPTDDIVCAARLVHTVTVIKQSYVHFEEVQDTCLPKYFMSCPVPQMTEFLLSVSVTSSCNLQFCYVTTW